MSNFMYSESMENNKKIKILALFFTGTGHTAKLANFIAEGASSVESTGSGSKTGTWI